ncbi:hypothetical protein BJ165DRAFT_1466797 [Panaeolus papilionaceus]|nr:hypothetical protein BJ165DRAFT_1466797 [Panaeolus papilionaceus]
MSSKRYPTQNQQLAKLSKKRNTTAEEIPSTTPKSMFSELPVEVLEIIFSFASPAPTHFEDKGFNAIKLVEFNHKGILILSQISSFLREVVISISSLWANIPTVYDIYSIAHRAPAKYRRRFNLVNLFLERARRSPLHVTIVDIHHHWLHCGKPCVAAARPLLGRCRRWRSLTLHFQIDRTFQDFEKNITQLRPAYTEPQFPMLETLTIKQRKINMNFLEVPVSMFSKAKNLKHIHFIGMDINQMVDVPWSQLRTYSGALLQFEQLRASSETMQELNLQRNLQYFENPPSVICFSQLKKLRFENVDFLHKLPKYYGDWRLDGTVLRCIEAPKLQTLEFSRYQALKQAPSVIDDLLMTTLRFPHDALRHLIFHIGCIPQQSLVDLLHSVPNLEVLDVWDAPTDHFSVLEVNADNFAMTTRLAKVSMVLVPRLRSLIIREWSDSKYASLVAVYDSRRSKFAQRLRVDPIQAIDLVYQQHTDCLHAQDRIEGWNDARKLVYKPRTDYQRVHGFSRHAAQRFLNNKGARRPEFYGVKLPRRTPKYNLESTIGFLKDLEKHQSTDINFIEVRSLDC